MAVKSTGLDRYFANVSAGRRTVANWRIYAAVTGSAMAMATNASAGVIYFNRSVTVGPVGNVALSSVFRQSQTVALKTAMGADIGVGFKVGIRQIFPSVGSQFGSAFITAATTAPKIRELVTGGYKLRQFALGANISSASGLWDPFSNRLASQPGTAPIVGWAPNATALAGFRFSTALLGEDYGWVRLSYTLGTNGLANSITATDWAYDPTGAPVAAGKGASSATPEPCTTALAILAAGAAGVAALRRRRQQISR